jgi:uncharacterized phiE125 gp8 family phage protein
MSTWHQLTRVTTSANTVVTLAEAKAQLRVTHTDDDEFIGRLIKVAQAQIDGPDGAGIAVVQQQWRLSLDAFPAVIRVPLNPVRAVVSITYDDGTVKTLSPTAYTLDKDRSPAVIAPAYGTSWPTARDVPGAVKVTFEAGYDATPEDLKQAALLLVSHYYENRDAAGDKAAELPFGVSAILGRYRPFA